MKVTGLQSDKEFLNTLKGNWNRFCNLYEPRKRRITKEESDVEARKESFVPSQVDLGKDFGRFYEIYLKHKILPDTKFNNNLDSSFSNTITDMFNLLGMNPYPLEKDNSSDAAYDVRYRGIMLIEYLIRLSDSPYRYIGLSLIRICIYLVVPVGVVAGLIAIWKQLFG